MNVRDTARKWMCGTWLVHVIHVCNVTHQRHEICGTWLVQVIHVWIVTHQRHENCYTTNARDIASQCICATWLIHVIHVCNMTHPCEGHCYSTHMWDMTHTCHTRAERDSWMSWALLHTGHYYTMSVRHLATERMGGDIHTVEWQAINLIWSYGVATLSSVD